MSMLKKGPNGMVYHNKFDREHIAQYRGTQAYHRHMDTFTHRLEDRSVISCEFGYNYPPNNRHHMLVLML